MTDPERKGFAYHVADEQLERYRQWPIERRLQWLFAANQLRNCLSARTLEIQEDFRNARI